MFEKELKEIIEEVNYLYNADYNMISFASLTRENLLQVVADVLFSLQVINTKLQLYKNTEENIIILINIIMDLKILGCIQMNPNEFTTGFLKGEKKIVYPILNWIISNKAEVIRREYFCRYLKKIVPPPDIRLDEEVNTLYAAYEKKVQEFKMFHAENSKYGKKATATRDLRNQMIKMAVDQKQITELLARQKVKVDRIPQREPLIVAVRAQQEEIRKEKYLSAQLDQQNQEKKQCELQLKKQKEVLQNLQSLRSAPGGPLQLLKDQVHAKKMLVTERLRKEINELEDKATAMEKVALDSDFTEQNLGTLKIDVQRKYSMFERLVEKKIMKENPEADKLNQFRQQATVVMNSKKIVEDSVIQLKTETDNVRKQISEKEAELDRLIGGSMPQGDKLHEFVRKLRVKAVVCKEKKGQLQELQAEVGILERTVEILKHTDTSLPEVLTSQKEKEESEEEYHTNDVDVLKNEFKQLVKDINNVRAEISKLKKNLASVTMQTEELKNDLETTKNAFENGTEGLNNEKISLETKTKTYNEEIKESEELWKSIKRETERSKGILSKINYDLFNAQDEHETEEMSLRKRVNEQSELKNELEQQIEQEKMQKDLDEQHVHMWHFTIELCKAMEKHVKLDVSMD